MAIEGTGTRQLLILAERLRQAEAGFKRDLYQAINEAAKPLAAEIRDPAHLRDYMPDRYADVLAGDMTVTVSKRYARDPGVSIRAHGTVHRRKVAQRNAGVITHPVFAEGPRKTWDWVTQEKGMRPGFFTDPVEKGAPAVREQVVAAMRETARRIASA